MTLDMLTQLGGKGGREVSDDGCVFLRCSLLFGLNIAITPMEDTRVIQGSTLFMLATLNPKGTAVAALMQKYIEQPHYSKRVPITHRSILAGSQSPLSWWTRTWPQQNFERLRALGRPSTKELLHPGFESLSSHLLVYIFIFVFHLSQLKAVHYHTRFFLMKRKKTCKKAFETT